MSFVDELRQSRESSATAFQEFIRNYPKNRASIHAFFEGHDDFSFYKGFISHYVVEDNQLKAYKCGNKNEVYKTYNKIIDSGRDDVTIIFFVDKDFSDLLGEIYPNSNRIYVTDHYSIENYIVSSEMLFRIWEEIFNFTNITFDYAKIEERFFAELQNYYAWALFLASWIILMRRNGEKPVLRNINLSKICSVNENMSFSGSDIIDTQKYVERVCSVTTPKNFESEINLIINEINKNEPKKYVRGKFELWFFVKFVNKLYLVIRSQLTKGESIKMRTQINEENAIEVLGPRTRIPESLKLFLENNIS